MKKYFSLFLLGGVLLGGVSCKKDSNEATPDNGGNAPAFVGKSWVVQFILQPAIDLDGKPDSDMVPFLDACNRDDSVVFQADHRPFTTTASDFR